MDTVTHFLAGVIACPRAGQITANNLYRKYRTCVNTSATIAGNSDTRTTTIVYEVGRRNATKEADLASTRDSAHKVECSYPTNKVAVEDFAGLAKKYSNFSANFEYSSLAGLAERLAKGLAAFSVHGDIAASDLRGNAALVINGLGTYDGPVNSLTNTIFIPRLVNSTLNNDVFIVLANCAAGEGASVATDVIELDANTRQPLVADIDGDSFPTACVDALRLIGANMIASDQGPLFSLAVTRGLHKVLSVVGHSDEGGITRDILRAGDFGVPFGGIHYDLDTYSGLPALQYNTYTAAAAYCDGIALATAAAVSHCDPGNRYNGEWFPTFYNGTSANDPTHRPGDNVEGTQAMADRNRGQLIANSSRFFENYATALGRIFGASGSVTLPTRFSTSALYHLGGNNRHLRYASVAPWFWIEPTGLLPHDLLGSDAEIHGSGSFAWRDTTRTRTAWEDIALAGARDTTFSGYHVKFTSPRRAWFLAHWLGHPLNGLGGIRVRQLDANTVVHPGPCEGNQQVRDRVEADLPITDYLWVRGQSPFCAPGELLNLSGRMGFLVRHLTFDDDAIPHPEHLPSAHEFIDTTVTIEVGRPVGLTAGPSNNPPRQVRRDRTRAANELNASKRRAGLFGRSDVAEMPTMSSAPDTRFTPAHDSERGGNNGGVPVGGDIHALASGPERNTAYDREPQGAPARAVGHYDAQKIPAIRPGNVVPPGAGPPPPIVRGGPDDPDADDRNPPEPQAPDVGAAPPDEGRQQ